MNDPFAFCEEVIRQRDHDLFLATLFVPAEARPHLFALYAFAEEIGHVADAVSEPMAGQIRLQWWRDALEGKNAPAEHPVLEALTAAIEKHSLPRDVLASFVDAHEFDLSGEPMPSLSALDQFLDATTGAIAGLAMRILDAQAAAREARAAFLFGRASGLMQKLRTVAKDASQGRVFIPVDILERNGGAVADVLAGNGTDAIKNALAALRKKISTDYDALKLEFVRGPVRAALLRAPFIPLYLRQMEKPGYEPFTSRIELSQLRKQFVLWRTARFETI